MASLSGGKRRLRNELALRRYLLEIGDHLGAASASASSEIFPLLSERLSSVVPIKSLTIWIVDHTSGWIRALYHSESDVQGRVSAWGFPIGDGATGRAVQVGTSVIANHQSGRGVAKYIPGTPEIPEHLLVVPVKVEEEVKVALTLRRNATDAPFLAEDARRAELFGQHLGSAFLLRELAQQRGLLAQQVEQLEELNRLKDDFLASVSHELRTPLAAIIGNVTTLTRLGRGMSHENHEHLLESTQRQARRLAEFLENLLAESRVVGGDVSILPTPGGMRPFLLEVAETLRSRAPDRLIETACEDELRCVTDWTLLYRIVFNLGDNALKYSQGPVWLAAHTKDNGICIQVTDRGVGIPQHHLGTIFQRFRQLDRDGNGHRAGGVGLGLHLSARLAEALGGRIDVESEVGRGSTFSVWLPNQPTDQVIEATAPMAQA